MSVPIRLDAGDDVANECLAADVYFGDDKLPKEDAQVVLMPGWGEERTIRLMTTKVIDEPVVTVYLVAGCSAKITRKFIAFADPPGAVPSVAVDAGNVVPPTASYSGGPAKVSVGGLSIDTGSAAQEPPVGGAPKLATNHRGKKVPKAMASVATHTGGSSAAPLAGAPSMLLSPKDHARASESKAPAGERLVLDTADLDATNLPNLRMSSAMLSAAAGDNASPEVQAQRAAAAALWRAVNASPEQFERDRQRMQELEQRLVQLQQESTKNRATTAALEARLQQAEAGASNPTVTYTLAGLVAVLAGGLLFFFIKGRRSQAGRDWWKSEAANAEAPESAVPPAEPALERTSATFASVKPTDDVHAVLRSAPVTDVAGKTSQLAAPAAPDNRAPAPTFSVSLPEASAAAEKARPVRPPLSDSAREVSVEELIDLEQQAEFFIVLGQDDAAIDLLESHVHSTTGASPLPYLKLLEIYQRLGNRPDYERVQVAFNQRFNAYAPAWESDLQQGHSLTDYPGIIERLQALWSEPAKAMDVLERSLTRPDDGVETFDLPAYRELLFLYAVARDRAERESEERLAVDLGVASFSDVERPAALTETAPIIEPLMATRPMKAQPHAKPSLAVDVSLDDLEPVEVEAKSTDYVPTEIDNTIEFEHIHTDFGAHTPPGAKRG
ncbi:MAG: hypothetical protein KGL90_03370 [Burkholderiales bacterium]|nr:hypothetical protein [Burkholderiales bacterium]